MAGCFGQRSQKNKRLIRGEGDRGSQKKSVERARAAEVKVRDRTEGPAHPVVGAARTPLYGNILFFLLMCPWSSNPGKGLET